MAENNPAMLKAAMRTALQHAKTEPINCAFGVVKNETALLLDKHKAGQFLVRMLKATVPDLKEPAAFGKAALDPDDAKHLQLTVNKGTAGLAKKLTKTVKGTGLRRVTILTDDAGLFETYESTDTEDDEDGGSVFPGNGIETRRPLPPTPPPRVVAPPGPNPVPTAPITPAPSRTPPLNPAQTVLAQIAQAAQALAAFPPDRKAAIGKQLLDARAAAMAGDLGKAGTLLGAARTAMQAPPTGGTAPAPATTTTTTTQQAAPTWSTAAVSPAQRAFNAAMRAATPDLEAVKAVTARSPAIDAAHAAMTGHLTTLKAQRAANDHVNAATTVDALRRSAVVIVGLGKQAAEQQDIYDRMSGPLNKVETTYFSKGANDAVRAEKLSPGAEFRAYLAALTAFEADRSLQNLGALEAAAKGYLGHYAGDLNDRQQNLKESQRKKAICETALVAAKHMRMALQMKDAGPPPWDEQTALRAASIRAQFSFESVGKKAEPLSSGDSGVSAAFWVEGWDETDDNDPGDEGHEDTSKKDFLFKPVDGEETQPGFPPRGSAPREAVTKAVADKIGAMTGIDLGVPSTAVVSAGADQIDVADYNRKKKAAILEENSNIEEADMGLLDPAGPLTGSLQQFKPSRGLLKDQNPPIQASIPAAECERIAVLDIITLNCDRHAGNLMVGSKPNATGGTDPTLIPIDHGLSLPSRKGMNDRGANRMNDSGGNALLRMPGSYQPFSQDTQDRLQMLDPAAIERGMLDSIAAVDDVHPELQASTKIPPDAAHLAKRAAAFLKLACRSLPPALVQLAIANCQAEIFDADDSSFDAAAAAVIATYAREAQAIQAQMLTPTAGVRNKLKALGYHSLGEWDSDVARYRRWFMANATALVAAAQANTPWSGQPPKPA